MKLNFKTLCACLALVMYTGNAADRYAMTNDEKDSRTSSRGSAVDTNSQKKRIEMPEKVYNDWMKAIRAGDIDKVRDYAEKQHYDVNASYYARGKQWSEMTALTFLAYVKHNDQLRIAELLLDNGADPNIGKGDALAHAISQEDTPLVKFLLENGANPNIKRERYGFITYPLLDAVKTAIHNWHRNAKGTILTRLLIEYGADINVKNEEGQTALMLVKEAIMKDDADDGVILHSVGKLMELLGVSEKELRQWLEEKKSKAKSRKPRDEDLWD